MFLHCNEEDQAGNHGHHDTGKGMLPVSRLCRELHVQRILNVHGTGVSPYDQLVGDDIIPGCQCIQYVVRIGVKSGRTMLK